MSKHIALVTGGTGGIGTAICQELLLKGSQSSQAITPGQP